MYAQRPSPAPNRVYCDASFLLHLYATGSAARLATFSPAQQANARAALNFFVWAKQAGSVFCASLLALEEVYKVVMFARIKDAMNRARVSDWKALRTHHNTEFAAAIGLARADLSRVNAYLASLGLKLIKAGRDALRSDAAAAARISGYARVLLNSFELDCMDAFHIALARFSGHKWAATGDADWKQVPTISVIGPP